MHTTKTSIAIIALATAALVRSLAGFTDESGTATAQDKKGDNAAVAATENILRNPGLDEGEKDPAEWTRGADVDGVEYFWDKQMGHGKEGKGSLCLSKTANRYFPIAQWYQTVERKDGSRMLHVSAQVKAERASKAVIDVIFLDENSDTISHEWASYIGAKKPKDPPATHDWKQCMGKVKIPQQARKIQICLQIYGPGKVWFDDVRAEYVE